MRIRSQTLSRVGVRIIASGKLGLYPRPCGEGRLLKRSEGRRGGGGAVRASVAPVAKRRTTPTPSPSPQGGGEQTEPVVRFRIKLEKSLRIELR
jgi:hypothetical protein